jgi:hypothetical protein
MRTTVTLDPDTAAKVKAEMRRTGQSFKQVLNGFLRNSPAAVESASRKPFKVRPIAAGERPGYNFDNIGELLEQVEGPDYK